MLQREFLWLAMHTSIFYCGIKVCPFVSIHFHLQGALTKSAMTVSTVMLASEKVVQCKSSFHFSVIHHSAIL